LLFFVIIHILQVVVDVVKDQLEANANLGIGKGTLSQIKKAQFNGLSEASSLIYINTETILLNTQPNYPTPF
jgi:hypothetical protein